MHTTTPAELNPVERDKIIDFLSKHPVGVLATVDAQGDPHATPIYFSVDADLHITFTTKQDTYKYENITNHPTVMLAVFEAETQTEVQISAKAVEVKDFQEQQDIYHGTLEAAKQTGADTVPPIAKIPAGKYVGFTLEIKNIWLSEYGWGDTFTKAMAHAQETETYDDPA